MASESLRFAGDSVFSVFPIKTKAEGLMTIIRWPKENRRMFVVASTGITRRCSGAREARFEWLVLVFAARPLILVVMRQPMPVLSWLERKVLIKNMADLSQETFLILNGLGDYIWKMRLQLNKIKENEESKLAEFDGDTLAMRKLLEAYKHEYLFPNALHYSFVVLLFIIVENRLKQLCDLIQTERTLPLWAKELRDDAVEQCMIFLERLVGIARSSYSTDPKYQIYQKSEIVSYIPQDMLNNLETANI